MDEASLENAKNPAAILGKPELPFPLSQSLSYRAYGSGEAAILVGAKRVLGAREVDCSSSLNQGLEYRSDYSKARRIIVNQ